MPIFALTAASVALVSAVAAAAVTDALDGIVGRRRHAGLRGAANVGAWLDPLCDKVFVVSTAASIAVHHDVAASVLALALLRDVALLLLLPVFVFVGGRARVLAHDYRARWSGKLTTVAQGLTFFAVVFAPRAVLACALAAAALGVVAVVERVVLAARPAP
jgi:cardiolipin synthase